MNCRGEHLERFIDLNEQPNGNHFPTRTELDEEPRFPFAMLVCSDCWQVQIEEFPPADTLFRNHPYITGVNRPVVQHFEDLAATIIEKFAVDQNSLVMDIGANDGTLLSAFRSHGMRVLGVDPCTRTLPLSQQAGVTVFPVFWNRSSAAALKQLALVPRIITATAVFYHVEDIHSFVQGLDLIMDEHTVFCAQCVDLKTILSEVQFDHFYHEHSMIHALAPLRRLFAEYRMKLLDVDYYPIHGGSFMVYVARETSLYTVSDKVDQAIEVEKAAGLDKLETYHTFTQRVNDGRADLLQLLKALKGQSKTVFGLGAPLKGSTLLNYYGIGPDLVKCVTEVNEHKIGRFTPGTHIPIVAENELDEQPDYFLVLAWNYIDFFLEKYADYLRSGGRFILPHPHIHTIGREVL